MESFGPSPDWRTGKHMENPGFTCPPKVLLKLFFSIEIPTEGHPWGIFLLDSRTSGKNLVILA